MIALRITFANVPQLSAEALALVLTPAGTPEVGGASVTARSDGDVLALTQVQMLPQQGC